MATFAPSISAQNPTACFGGDISPPLPASYIPGDEGRTRGTHVWMIFGVTTNFSRALAEACLARGDRVIGIGWCIDLTPAQIKAFMYSCAAQVMSLGVNVNRNNVMGLVCEPRVQKSVDLCVKTALREWGRIDVVVQGFSYGVMSSCEDQNDNDLRGQFEFNFFATMNIISTTLPYFTDRAAAFLEKEYATYKNDDDHSMSDESSQQSPQSSPMQVQDPSPNSAGESSTDHVELDYPVHGRYLILNPAIGTIGTPGLGPYCATRYAIEGLIESMMQEVGQDGIKVTSTYLGKMYPIPTNPPNLDLPSIASNLSSTLSSIDQGVDEHNQGFPLISDSPPPVLSGDITNLPSSISTVNPFTPLPSSPPSQHYSHSTAPAAYPSRLVEWATAEYQRKNVVAPVVNCASIEEHDSSHTTKARTVSSHNTRQRASSSVVARGSEIPDTATTRQDVIFPRRLSSSSPPPSIPTRLDKVSLEKVVPLLSSPDNSLPPTSTGASQIMDSRVCADLIWRLGHASAPPVRFPVGAEAVDMLLDKVNVNVEEIEDWKYLNFSTE